MIIKDRKTDEVIGKILTNRSMTLDEAMELIGYPWQSTDYDDDAGYNVDGVYYHPDDLVMCY